MNPGARVRFKAHGETGLVCTVITRDGDDVTLQDSRGRLLHRTPIELLVLVPPDEDDTVRVNTKAFREVDGLQ